MITFITGAPGSGKTLYTIAKLLKPMLGTTVTKHNDDGTTTELPRTIYTNIKGFLFDHELIDDGAEGGLNNWHEWAKPGSIICFDEVQKPWPPRPNGAKVPDYIQHLETHRHMGVDFIVMTQHPLLVDRNLVNLVGRHLHLRRIANWTLAVVYEWDHCSRSLLYRNAVNKNPWRYDKSVYKVYKSAEVHTKQPRKVPGLVWFILVGLAGFAYLGPTTFNRISDRAQGKTPGVSAKTMQPMAPAQLGTVPAPGQVPAVASAPAGAPAAADPAPQISGCIASPTRCTCFDDKGRKVEKDAEMCTDLVEARPSPLGLLPDTPRLAVADPDDLDVRTFMQSQRGHLRAD